MDGVNTCHIAGIVTAPVDLRSTSTGTSVVNLTIATRYRGETSHHRAVVWGKAAEYVAANVRRGQVVYVMGPLTYREYEDGNAQARLSVEINAVQVQLLGEGDRAVDGNVAPPRDYCPDGNTL